VALPFTLKKGSLGKRRRIMETQIYISPCKNYIIIIFQKNPLKKTKNPSRYYNSVANIKFQHKPKYHLQKPSYKNKHIT
jgi:hypothetical protein